jgi:hypothetical protein
MGQNYVHKRRASIEMPPVMNVSSAFMQLYSVSSLEIEHRPQHAYVQKAGITRLAYPYYLSRPHTVYEKSRSRSDQALRQSTKV